MKYDPNSSLKYRVLYLLDFALFFLKNIFYESFLCLEIILKFTVGVNLIIFENDILFFVAR